MRTIEILSEQVFYGVSILGRGQVVDMADEDALPLVVCKAARFVDGRGGEREVAQPAEGAPTEDQLTCPHPAGELMPAVSMGHPLAILCKQCGARVEDGRVIGSDF